MANPLCPKTERERDEALRELASLRSTLAALEERNRVLHSKLDAIAGLTHQDVDNFIVACSRAHHIARSEEGRALTAEREGQP